MANPQPILTDQTVGPASIQELRAPAPQLVEAQVNSTLQEEILILRERGLSDECIHGLFSGFNIDARPGPSGHHWTLPHDNQLVRLIWGKIHPTQVRMD